MAGCVQAMNLRSEAPLRSYPGWPVAPTGMAGREGRHEGRYVVGSVAAAGRSVLGVCSRPQTWLPRDGETRYWLGDRAKELGSLAELCGSIMGLSHILRHPL